MASSLSASALQVGIVGFGRFGRSLAELVDRAGGRVRAFDPYLEPPVEVRAATLSELVAGATHVVLAVPFGHLAESLRAVTPVMRAAGSEALLMDACSV